MEDIEITARELVEWIKNTVQGAGGKGIVLGLSGGVDSAVVAAAAKQAFPETTLGIIMPCHSNPEDEEDAILLASSLNIDNRRVELDEVYDTFIKMLNLDGTRLALANIKPRLRMITLYYHAAVYNYLVAGTGNKSEIAVGYFTKHGDSGVDILPIASFVKHDVWELARYFNVPEKIINKAPSAGLWDNQTDEKEMGITYKELDKYILTGEADERIKNIIEKLNKGSQHKREYPRIFVPKNK